MYTMKIQKNRQTAVPIKLTMQNIGEIDHLVNLGVFASRSEAIKFAIRLMLLIEKSELPLSRRAEEYAYEEIKNKFERIKNVRRG